MEELRKSEEYVRGGIWSKLKRTASKVPFVADAVALYFCALDTKTPIHAKVTALSALAYFITPVDGVMDAVPLLGYGDDAGAIALALSALGKHITDEHRQKTEEWLSGAELKKAQTLSLRFFTLWKTPASLRFSLNR
ncbi:YkvA family protein [Andreesenia angusta]|nr:YkvA family protein [Andreesenia angusta]